MLRAMRSTVLAVALLVLAAGAVHARPLAAHRAPTGLFDALWQWVASYVPGWAKEGGMIDPNGASNHLLPPLPTSDSGGAMDPNG